MAVAIDHEGQGEPKANIFISYSRRDGSFVDRIDDGLKARGFRPLIDRSDIQAFEDWWQRIEALIAQADTILFVISPDAVASDTCAKELAFAASLNKRFAPIVCRATDIAKVPDQLRALNFIVFDGGLDFDPQIDRLAQALVVDLGWIREHTWIGALASRWDRSSRPDALLLRGDELAKSERWLQTRSPACPQPTELQLAYIAASRGKLAEREQSLANAAINSNQLTLSMMERLRKEGVSHALIASMLQTAQAVVDNLGADGAESPSLLRARGVGLVELSSTLLAQGDALGALDAAENAGAIFDKIAAAEGWAPHESADRFVSLDRCGDALFAIGRYEDALDSYQRALALARAAIAVDGGNPTWLRHLSVALEKVADSHKQGNRLEQSLELYTEGLALRDAIVAREAAIGEPHRDLATGLERIADVAHMMGRNEEAIATYRKSLAVRDTLTQAYPKHMEWWHELALTHERLGDVHRGMRSLEAANCDYEEERAITDRLVRSDAGNRRWRNDHYRACGRAGRILIELGRPSDALEIFGPALDLAKAQCLRQPETEDWRAAAAFFQHVCATLAALDRLEEALTFAEESARFLERDPNTDLARTKRAASAWSNAAWHAILLGRADTAFAAAQKASGLMPDDPAICVNLLHALVLTGRFDDAQKLYAYCRNVSVSDVRWVDMVRSDLTELDRRGVDTQGVRSLLAT